MYKQVVSALRCGTIIPMKRSIFILFLLGFTIANQANAQLRIESSDIEVNLYPSNPTPNQSVMVEIKSFITNLDAAQVTWSLNGEILASGAGIKSLTFKTGPENTVSNLNIIIITEEGYPINKNVLLNPIYVDLLWESESYTPPFYKGKALFSYQNKITFIAIPHIKGNSGVEISPKNLIYKWKKNGVVMERESGQGKNTYVFTPTVIARPFEVTVEVTSPSVSTTGNARVNISPTDPFVQFYEKNPLYGIQFQKSLIGSIDMLDSKEIAVTAVPFFFGTNSPYENISYKWLINNSAIDENLSETTRVFRQVEGVSGIAKISLSIGHSYKILQLANKSFDLNFRAQESEDSVF